MGGPDAYDDFLQAFDNNAHVGYMAFLLEEESGIDDLKLYEIRMGIISRTRTILR